MEVFLMRMDVYDFKFFKDEIMRGFRACGVQGEYTNFLMIKDAFEKHPAVCKKLL